MENEDSEVLIEIKTDEEKKNQVKFSEWIYTSSQRNVSSKEIAPRGSLRGTDEKALP